MATKMMPQVSIIVITAWQRLESHPFVWAFRRLLLAYAAGRSQNAQSRELTSSVARGDHDNLKSTS
jgi:hypothetical protein